MHLHKTHVFDCWFMGIFRNWVPSTFQNYLNASKTLRKCLEEPWKDGRAEKCQEVRKQFLYTCFYGLLLSCFFRWFYHWRFTIMSMRLYCCLIAGDLWTNPLLHLVMGTNLPRSPRLSPSLWGSRTSSRPMSECWWCAGRSKRSGFRGIKPWLIHQESFWESIDITWGITSHRLVCCFDHWWFERFQLTSLCLESILGSCKLLSCHHVIMMFECDTCHHRGTCRLWHQQDGCQQRWPNQSQRVGKRGPAAPVVSSTGLSSVEPVGSARNSRSLGIDWWSKT